MSALPIRVSVSVDELGDPPEPFRSAIVPILGCRGHRPVPGPTARRARAVARLVTDALVESGALTRDAGCSSCGAPQCAGRGGRLQIILHHPDYAKPWHVVPLCRRCHQFVHGPGRSAEKAPAWAWEGSSDDLERAIRQAVSTAHRPNGMSAARFREELAVRGLEGAFSASRAARRSVRGRIVPAPLPFVGLGQLLKRWMERSGINAEELGPKLGCGRSTVVNWCEGRYRPGFDRLSAIAADLGLSAEEAAELYAFAGAPLPAVLLGQPAAVGAV